MQNFKRQLRRYNPAVSKYWLLGLAGAMWAGVGIMLCLLAYGWLTHPVTRVTLICAALGVGIALAANRFGFTRLAHKNIKRILRLPARACVFSFQAWSGYLIIAFMMTLGIVLRHSPLPKAYLAVVYVAVGGALLQASLNYFARLARVIAQGRFPGAARRPRLEAQD